MIYKLDPHRPSKHIQSLPICIFCYHKVGTKLLGEVFWAICKEYGWRLSICLGKVDEIPNNAEVIIFVHSLTDIDSIQTPFFGVHFVRDPRDVIVSGYLYHCRTQEKWCINTNFDLTPPISCPRVPYSQEHRSEAWKKKYLKSLHNKSYQQNLLEMSLSEGLIFEMQNYGAWTIESMMQWNYNNESILEVRFEELMQNYDATFLRIFKHFGFSQSMVENIRDIAAKFDLNRMTEDEIRSNQHISPGQIIKWPYYFKNQHKKYFRKQFGSILVELGYETSNEW